MGSATTPASIVVFDPASFLVFSKLFEVAAVIEGVLTVITVGAVQFQRTPRGWSRWCRLRNRLLSTQKDCGAFSG